MKVLQINTVVNSGSTGRIAEDIGTLLKENDHNSIISYGRNPRPSNSKLIKIGTKLDIVFHFLKSYLQDKHGLGSKRATKKFVKQLEKIRPSIIHLHNLHGYYLNYPLLFNFIKEYKIPVVWTLHDCWAFTGHCSHYESSNCYKWKTHCNNCPSLQINDHAFLLTKQN